MSESYVFLPDMGLVVKAHITKIADAVVLDFGRSVHEAGEDMALAKGNPTLAIRNGHGEYWNKEQSILVAPAGRLAPFHMSRN